MWQVILWALEFTDSTDLDTHLSSTHVFTQPSSGLCPRNPGSIPGQEPEQAGSERLLLISRQRFVSISHYLNLPPGDLSAIEPLTNVNNFLKAVSLWWIDNGFQESRDMGHVA